MTDRNDRFAGLYPPGPGLAWALSEFYGFQAMIFHARSSCADARHMINWEDEHRTDDQTRVRFKIEGTSPVDRDPNGYVSMLFEAFIATPEGELHYKETLDIRTTAKAASEAAGVNAVATASLFLPQSFPASLFAQFPGKWLEAVVGGDHPLLRAIRGQMIRNVLTLNQPGHRSLLEFDCSAHARKLAETHQTYENRRLTEGDVNA